MYENAILPEVIMNGSKFLIIEVPHLRMKFIDSMNFIPMALSKIPKAFNLSELAKGYFPHLFNNRENQQTILDCLPDMKYYNPGDMMPEDREILYCGTMNIKTTHFISRKRSPNIERSPNIADLTWIS